MLCLARWGTGCTVLRLLEQCLARWCVETESEFVGLAYLLTCLVIVLRLGALPSVARPCFLGQQKGQERRLDVRTDGQRRSPTVQSKYPPPPADLSGTPKATLQ